MGRAPQRQGGCLVTVMSGEVRTTITMRGAGDGAAKVDGMKKSVDGLEGSVGKTRKGFGALGTSLQQVAGVASPALGALARDIGDVSGLVGEVAGRFGLWGTVVAGVVTGIGALVAVLVSGEPTLSTYGKAMESAAKQSSNMATAITQIASEARVAQGALESLGKTALGAFASLQDLRGQKDAAAETRAKLGAVEASGEAAKAEVDFTLTVGKLATADAMRKAAIDDITYAERDLLEAQLRHDDAAVALAAVRLTNSRFAKAEAESAVRDLTPLVQRLATTAGALRGLANEQQLQANMVPGVEFFQPDAETQKYVNKGGAPGDPWDEADTAWEAKRQKFGPGGGRGGALTRGGFASLERTIGDATGRDAEAERVRDLTAGIRDFTSALEGAVPSTSAFAGALEQVRSIWEAWGQGAQTTRQAVIGSLGAIAMASAQGIKGERERAGVLGAIYMGLGIAHVVTPGMQVQGAGEIAGGAMLIAAALTTPSSGSRGRGGGRGSGPVRAMGGETMAGGGAPMVVNINAPWFGPSPQEAMAGLGGMLRATAGTGWEAGR